MLIRKLEFIKLLNLSKPGVRRSFLLNLEFGPLVNSNFGELTRLNFEPKKAP